MGLRAEARAMAADKAAWEVTALIRVRVARAATVHKGAMAMAHRAATTAARAAMVTRATTAPPHRAAACSAATETAQAMAHRRVAMVRKAAAMAARS